MSNGTDRDPWLDEPLTDEERASIESQLAGPMYDLDTLEPVSRATPHGIAAALKADPGAVVIGRRLRDDRVNMRLIELATLATLGMSEATDAQIAEAVRSLPDVARDLTAAQRAEIEGASRIPSVPTPGMNEHTRRALTIDCPRVGCGATFGVDCRGYNLIRSPHPERIEAARVRDAAIASVVDTLGCEALVPVRAIDAMRRLCAHGAAKHGCAPGASKPGVTVDDHVEAARRHLSESVRWRGDYAARDDETGELHLAHAMTRLALAVAMMEVARGS